MKKLSPLYIDEVQFCAFTFNEKEQAVHAPWELTFDKRHDFLVDSTFAGIAARIIFSNDNFSDGQSKGLRRNISLTLVDTTLRCEAAVKQIRVNMPGDNPIKFIYADYHLPSTELKAGHTYKLVARDETAAVTIDELVFHLFGQEELGCPTDWYKVDGGGIRPDWENGIYKSICVSEYKTCHVRFNIEQNFGNKPPMIMPELEIRLHYPDSDRIEVRFIEPECVDYNTNRYFAELPFFTSDSSSGVYYAELLCMEYPIAGFVFRTNGHEANGEWFGKELEPLSKFSNEAACARFDRSMPAQDTVYKDDDEFEEALNKFISNELEAQEENDSPDEADEETPAEAPSLISLDQLTGLRSVKEKLSVYERVVRFNKLRADKGLPVSSTPLHAMFLGSPGTGKTTVAKIIGIMLRRAGILSRGHVVVRERATLLGRNYNSESENTLAAIEKAQGGILLIDEAYQLYQPNDSRDPGKFVIETLLTALADESKRDWMLILAGYPEEMKQMFDMNPGLKSRIPESNIYLFDDFSEAELMEIAEKYLSRNRYTLTPEAHSALTERLKADYSRREKNFGNARHIINMIQTEVIPAMAVRVTTEGATNESALTEIKAADIPRPISQRHISRPRIGFTL